MLLTACSENDTILQGKRENIFAVVGDAEADTSPVIADAAAGDGPAPISLPPAQTNTEWTQTTGSAAGRPQHPALRSAPQLVWSAKIGSGDGPRSRITADPVVGGGRVFAMDSSAQISAHSTDGAALWSVDLVPENDSPNDGSGGGLAYSNGKVFVSSGFGRLTALDAATGRELWEQELRQTATGSPAVYGNLVYLVAGDDVAWALDTDTGRIKWRLTATPDVNNIHGGPAPAISEKYAVFAFGSGELQGAFRKGGLRLWDAQIAGRRDGLAQSSITDVVGDPVIDGDRIYVGNSAGRMAAFRLANGARIWSANEGPMGPVWPAGGDLFLVSDRNELVRLDGETGTRIWGAKLPFFTKDRPRRQAEIYAHQGPVIAGGQVVVASNDGLLRFFDPVSGALQRTVEVPGGATTAPVVANQTLYVVSTKGTLHAFR
ncbi:PQQ-binding-like beta-propeller repeat protein [Pseudohalocynthiibacter aestuariivivens]|nr:PQQ-binding-like beta-propeller repeat protein [Pseudohalocynthiibacter aestuariivivens]